MIKLTLADGTTRYINPDYLVSLIDHGNGTCEVLVDDPRAPVTLQLGMAGQDVYSEILQWYEPWTS